MKSRMVKGFACCIAFYCLTLTALAQAETKTRTLEDTAWSKVDALKKASLERYLKEFPKGTHSDEATRYLAMHKKMSDVKEGKAKLTSGITEEQLGSTWKAWKKQYPYVESCGVFVKKTDSGTTMGTFDPVGGGATPSGMAFDENQNPMLPTGDGSIVGMKTGGIKMHYLGLVFETPDEQAMIFGVVENVGLVHLGGVGKVTLADGKVIEFK